MTIQKENVRNFWAAQAKKSNLGNEGISNLEEDKNLLEKKINLEQEKIMPFIKQHFDENSKVLDLGSGTGQWALNDRGKV